MPTFFEGLRRLLAGQPIFQPEDIAPGSEGNTPANNYTEVPYPRVTVDTCDSRVNGDDYVCYSTIRNYSDQEVFLDKIRLMGETNEIDDNLKAGERKQFTIYSGSMQDDTSANDAELQFRDTAGNYFIARHDVRFKLVNDDYVIDKLVYENTSKL